MKDFLNSIVDKSKVNNEIINTRIKHPILNKVYPKRNLFVLLEKYAKNFFETGSEPRMIGVSGIRGTGKTTLMWQVCNFLYKKYNYPIYFFNVNELTTAGFTLLDTFEAFQKRILKTQFNKYLEPYILLLDEVHDSPDWAKVLKILHDESRSVFVICTGSSALLLKQTADLARRIKIEKLYPFWFTEYITAKCFFSGVDKIFPTKGLRTNFKNILFYSDSANEVYENLKDVEIQTTEYFAKIEKKLKNRINSLLDEYIELYNIPSFLTFKERGQILDGIYDLFKRVVYEDVTKLDELLNVPPSQILKLLMQLSLSDEINYESLSQKTGIKRNDLEAILNIIEQAELINILSSYGGGESRIWKNKKVFFMSPSLRLSLLTVIYGYKIPESFKGKLYEDVVVMYLKKMFNEMQVYFAKTENAVSPDLVIETKDKPILLEIGTSKLKTGQLKQKIDKRYGILVSKSLKKLEIEDNIVKIPLKLFLLL